MVRYGALAHLVPAALPSRHGPPPLPDDLASWGHGRAGHRRGAADRGPPPNRLSLEQLSEPHAAPRCCVTPRAARARIRRRSKHQDRVSLCRGQVRAATHLCSRTGRAEPGPHRRGADERCSCGKEFYRDNPNRNGKRGRPGRNRTRRQPRAPWRKCYWRIV